MPDAPSPTPQNPSPAISPAIPADVVALLRCPVTHSPLRLQGDQLIAELPADAPLRYPIRDGLPLLLPNEAILPPGVADLTAYRDRYVAT